MSPEWRCSGTLMPRFACSSTRVNVLRSARRRKKERERLSHPVNARTRSAHRASRRGLHGTSPSIRGPPVTLRDPATDTAPNRTPPGSPLPADTRLPPGAACPRRPPLEVSRSPSSDEGTFTCPAPHSPCRRHVRRGRADRSRPHRRDRRQQRQGRPRALPRRRRWAAVPGRAPAVRAALSQAAPLPGRHTRHDSGFVEAALSRSPSSRWAPYCPPPTSSRPPTTTPSAVPSTTAPGTARSFSPPCS